MAKINKRNIRKLAKVGGGATYSITLPIDDVRELGWREKQKLVVTLDKRRKRFIIKDWPSPVSRHKKASGGKKASAGKIK